MAGIPESIYLGHQNRKKCILVKRGQTKKTKRKQNKRLKVSMIFYCNHDLSMSFFLTVLPFTVVKFPFLYENITSFFKPHLISPGLYTLRE